MGGGGAGEFADLRGGGGFGKKEARYDRQVYTNIQGTFYIIVLYNFIQSAI